LQYFPQLSIFKEFALNHLSLIYSHSLPSCKAFRQSINRLRIFNPVLLYTSSNLIPFRTLTRVLKDELLVIFPGTKIQLSESIDSRTEQNPREPHRHVVCCIPCLSNGATSFRHWDWHRSSSTLSMKRV